jgi:glycosyltransferase involved in cell wall biosynthesis
MAERRFRVLAVATHPVQYQVPIFRRMALRQDLDLQVAYCTLRGVEAAHDPEFGVTVKWDVPLLDGYCWVHVPNRGSGAEGFWGLRNSGLLKLIRRGNFDAVLCYASYTCATFWIAYLAARLSKTAFLFGTDTITLAPRDSRAWKRFFKGVFWPILFRRADQVIVPSSGTRQLMRAIGIPDQRITLTPYVVDNDWWLARSALSDRDAVRASWGATPGDTVVLYCAKLQYWKRPIDLLHAFVKVSSPRGMLVFVGEGPLRANLEAEVIRLAAERVKFLGFANQSELPAIYSGADLFVLPSEYEPFAVVVNEAMLCGLPVAASNRVGAAGDLIEHNRTGFVFPCGDVDALVRILQRAFRNPQLLAEMGSAARIRMESWSPQQNVDATIAAISRGVARRGRGPKLSQSGAAGAVESTRSSAQKISE